MISVRLGGAFRKPGRYQMAEGAKLSNAIATAGGLVHGEEPDASGVLTLRRFVAPKKVYVRRVSCSPANPQLTEDPLLEDGDVVTAQWHIRFEEP
jgi:protein involved in polysaccharide export with SLBB domain